LLLFFFLTVKYRAIFEIDLLFSFVDPKSRGDKSIRSALRFLTVFCHFVTAREVFKAFGKKLEILFPLMFLYLGFAPAFKSAWTT